MKKGKKEPIQTVKGMHDILPNVVPYYDRVIKETRRIAEFYGFQTIRTPHVERKELFTTTLGDSSDVIEKQMYSFRTRGGSPLVLRPEGTAALMRAYHQNGMQSWPQPVKLFYNGSFFRHESPQAGRTREFQQAGVEVLGDGDAINDALVIRLMLSALEALHLRDVEVHINSIGDKNCRPQYKKELTAFFKKRQQSLCKDCKRRLKDNPMRILDCKENDCQRLSVDAPHTIDYLCDFCKEHFKMVLEYLDEMNIEYTLDSNLVRGFDYYTKTVFELILSGNTETIIENKNDSTDQENTENSEEETSDKSEENSNKVSRDKSVLTNKSILLTNAIGGGGRFDELSEALYGKSILGVGAALGIDRVVSVMRERKLKVRPEITVKVFLIQLGPQAKKKSLIITEDLRKSGIPFTHMPSKESLRSQLKAASKAGVIFTIIVGQKEAIDEVAILREMNTGSQESVPFAKLVTTIKLKMKQL